MSLRSRQTCIVFRGSREEARQFLAGIRPALLALTAFTGIVCREERDGKTNPAYEVRAMCEARVAAAIDVLGHRHGREAVTEAMVVKYLEEER